MPSGTNKSKLDRIVLSIRMVHGQRVILDSDLAALYGVTTGRLNEQVKRNIHRFPEDFTFRLLREEFDNLISQSATSSSTHGGRRTPPLVFTEHGALMAANILNSPSAVEMSVYVVRAFVRLRDALSSHRSLRDQLTKLEQRVGTHDKHIKAVFEAIRQLMPSPERSKRAIGFHERNKMTNHPAA